MFSKQIFWAFVLLQPLIISAVDVNDNLLNDLVERIGVLEERGKAQELLIKDLQDQVTELQREKTRMLKNDYQHERNMKFYNDHVTPQQNGNKEATSSILKIVKRSLNNTLPETNLTAEYQDALLLSFGGGGGSGSSNYGTNSDGLGRVAFHATIDKNTGYPYAVSHLTVGQVIVFDQEKVNIGSGYHRSTGLFIAPLPGVYMFSASVMTKGEIQLNIVKNGVPTAGMFASDRQQGSVTMVTELQVGDEILVRVQSPNDAYIWGDRLTSFCGFLIA
ncbi:cerebellin-3-like [Ruditapes philippinarum]|uniref:cerebellin-3-like n=1 Tax=Ruditapes philippinarum TaxID=129788 RepID=UPI00295B98F0|nr:cerebellin-3-like [Ruditapes philippinarum]